MVQILSYPLILSVYFLVTSNNGISTLVDSMPWDRVPVQETNMEVINVKMVTHSYMYTFRGIKTEIQVDFSIHETHLFFHSIYR